MQRTRPLWVGHGHQTWPQLHTHQWNVHSQVLKFVYPLLLVPSFILRIMVIFFLAFFFMQQSVPIVGIPESRIFKEPWHKIPMHVNYYFIIIVQKTSIMSITHTVLYIK